MQENNQHIAALVSYPVYPAKMGGQKGIAFFYRYLSKLVPVTVISTRNNIKEDVDGVSLLPVISNSASRYYNPFLFFTLKRIMKERSISHLILEHPYYGWLGMMLRLFTRTTLIVHSHNIESLRFKSMGKWWWGILWNYEKLTHRIAHFSFFIQDDDREYAIKNFKLDPKKTATITYGFELNGTPAAADKDIARQAILNQYSINADSLILLFNGTLDYQPNTDALDILLEQINPAWMAIPGFKYTLIICGNKLPERYAGLAAYRDKNIIYAGFVDDITAYFKGADIFINPVMDGGGIKTKVVEALGYNLSVLSTRNGAIGIPQEITGDKMKIHDSENWENFAKQVLTMKNGSTVPPAFFDHFYWGHIAEKAVKHLPI